MRRNIIIILTASLTFTSCGLYNKYEQKSEVPANAFGSSQDILKSANDTSLAQMSWREFFTDPLLQQLIEQVLENNTDLYSARIAVEKSEAALKMAKMAYLPSLYLSPQGTLAKFDNNPWSKTYNLPLQLSMDVDVFGSITNKKRASKAALLQAQAYCSYLIVSWKFSIRPTVYGTPLLKHRNPFGKMASRTPPPSTRWSHLT